MTILKVSKIRAIQEESEKTKTTKKMIYQEEKKRSEREMDLSTELLAGASVEEPQFFKVIRSATLIKAYLALCTVINNL